MLEINNITWKQRMKELFIDYIFILIYLTVLLTISTMVYFTIFKGVPELNERESQLISTFLSVVPIVLIFSVLDYTKGSLGKRKAGLKLYYNNRGLVSSIVRNVIKFLPWQLGHMGVIRGIYSDFDIMAIIFVTLSFVIAIILLIMGIIRKDKRHLGDLIAGTQVQNTKGS